MNRVRRSTAPGEHRPVLLTEVMTALAPQPGETVIDCTTGWAGHSVELLKAVGPSGRLFALDLDGENLPKARERLMEVGNPFSLHQANFASLQAVLANENISAVPKAPTRRPSSEAPKAWAAS